MMPPRGPSMPCFLQFPWELLFPLQTLCTCCFLPFGMPSLLFLASPFLVPPFLPWSSAKTLFQSSPFMDSSHPSLCSWNMAVLLLLFTAFETPCCPLSIAPTPSLPASLSRFPQAVSSPTLDAWPSSWGHDLPQFTLHLSSSWKLCILQGSTQTVPPL